MFKALRNLFAKNPKLETRQTVTREAKPVPKQATPAAPVDLQAFAAYLQWRNVIFAVRPENAGLTVTDEELVYGVVMDLGVMESKNNPQPPAQNKIISVTAFASIESSLKSSFGTGIIGIGAHEQVAKQIEQLMPLAQALLPMCKFVENSDLPKAGEIYFYFLTTKGRRLAQTTLQEVMIPLHSFAQLFSHFSQIKAVADKLMSESAKN